MLDYSNYPSFQWIQQMMRDRYSYHKKDVLIKAIWRENLQAMQRKKEGMPCVHKRNNLRRTYTEKC